MVFIFINAIQMNKTLYEIFKSREDISDYLFHFTTGANAKEILERILIEKKIRDVKKRGYVCFTDSPITMLSPMFEIFERYENPMYAPYGIGIKKEYLYKKGARPVLYLEPSKKKELSDDLRWLYVPYEYGKKDFSWLREWRIPLSTIDLNFDNCFVIVKCHNDILEINNLIKNIGDVDVDAQPEDGGVLTEYTVYYDKTFRVLSFDELNSVSKLTKQQLQTEINTQSEQDVFRFSSFQ